MKTEAVMCMAFTSTSPSEIPLARRHRSTSGVMLTNPRRAGTSNQSSWRKDFMMAGVWLLGVARWMLFAPFSFRHLSSF